MSPPEGSVIDDRYLLEERLGGGGFGAVYLAEQRLLGVPVRRVAVKLSHRAGMSLETAREVFQDELLLAEVMDEMTDSAARRHLVHVYDAGVTGDGRAYLATEYVEGTTLAAQLESYQRVPLPLLLRWAREICVVLGGLHSLDRPVLHRDLKPDNVLLGTDSTVRLVDFGLSARWLRLGHAPGTVGTFAYMAPETVRGESVPASDLYSLGLIIYEGLTGRHPFEQLAQEAVAGVPPALHAEWLHDRKRRYRPDPPSAWNRIVPRHVDEAVLRCLEFEPARRYSGAEDLLDALAEPRPAGHDHAALDEAGRLRGEGDLRAARRVLESGVYAVPAPPPAGLRRLLDELGAVLTELGEHQPAAERLHRVWDLVNEHPTLAPTSQERAAVARRAAGAYERAGNRYMAARFRWLADKEGRGRNGEGQDGGDG